MGESSRKSLSMRPMTLAEMMPGLTGLLSESEVQKYSARKPPKNLQRALQSTSKDFKPYPVLTMAQLQAETQFLRPKVSPSRNKAPQSVTKRWNTSTKCDNKHMSITTGINKKLAARKILNFQQPSSKPKKSNIPQASVKPAFLLPQTPRQVKQSKKASKALNDDNKLARISGICRIQDTSVYTEIFNTENKENYEIQRMTSEEHQGAFDESFRQLTGYKKPLPTPRLNSIVRKSIAPPLLKTRQNIENKPNEMMKHQQITEIATNTQPMNKTQKVVQTKETFINIQIPELLAPLSDASPSNSTTSDQSFLEREKVIYRETVRETIQQNEESPIVSTPFKSYRKVEEYFNESTKLDTSNSQSDVTIIDGSTSLARSNDSRELSDISTLCNLLDKAQVTNNEVTSDNYKMELLKVKGELESERENIILSLKRNEIILNSVNKMLKSLEKIRETDSVRKTGANARRLPIKSHTSKSEVRVDPLTTVQKSFIRHVKSPSYTIPKRSPCLRKRAICKSVPLNLHKIPPDTPPVPLPRSKSVAMYMKMKEQCNFLVTPMVNKTRSINDIANTPAVTSNNLQSQLQRLYDETS